LSFAARLFCLEVRGGRGRLARAREGAGGAGGDVLLGELLVRGLREHSIAWHSIASHIDDMLCLREQLLAERLLGTRVRPHL
jgi:hypothetical protein